MSDVVITDEVIKENLNKFKPFIIQMIAKFSKVQYYCQDQVISWANQGIMEALKNIPEDCKNKSSYIMGYIQNYVLLGLRKTGHFIRPKSKWDSIDPEIRKLNNIVSLDSNMGNIYNSEATSFADIMPSAILPPDLQMEEDEKVETINNSIDNLSPEYANIIRQYVYEEKTFQQIGDSMGCFKQVIEQKYKKALRKLEYALKDKI